MQKDKEQLAIMNENKVGTLLICPDCSGEGRGDTMSIELCGGLIYEIINADGGSSNIQSGTKVILPPGSEITDSSKIDLKGGKLRVCDV